MDIEFNSLTTQTSFSATTTTRSGLPDSDAIRRIDGTADAISPLVELGESLRGELVETSPFADIKLSDDAKRALASADEALAIARAFNREDGAELLGSRAAASLKAFAEEIFTKLGDQEEFARGRAEDLLTPFGQEIADRARGLVGNAAVGGFELTQLSVSVRSESYELSINDEDGETRIKLESFELSVELTHIEAGVVADDRFKLDLGDGGFAQAQDDAAARLAEVFDISRDEASERQRLKLLLGDLLERQPLASLIGPVDNPLGGGVQVNQAI